MSHQFRVFISSTESSTAASPGATVTLSAGDTHHVSQVLRLREGDGLIVVDLKSGKEFVGKITQLRRGQQAKVLLEVDFISTTGGDLSPVRAVLFAICKGDTNDIFAEKACELGVRHLIFWEAHRSVQKAANWRRRERLERLVYAAAKQSGRTTIPQIKIFHSLEKALEDSESQVLLADALNLYASTSLGAQSIGDLFPIEKECNVVIGPEADFTDHEETLLTEHHFIPVSLGRCRLRSETAGLTAVASVRALYRKA